jgi:hypothetical protein
MVRLCLQGLHSFILPVPTRMKNSAFYQCSLSRRPWVSSWHAMFVNTPPRSLSVLAGTQALIPSDDVLKVLTSIGRLVLY